MYLYGPNMKINAFLLILATVLSLTWMGCKRNYQGESSNDEPALVTDSSEKSDQFKDEMSVYESADRVIWQKPDLVIQELGDVDGKVVADIGAGTGYFSRRIAYKGAKVIAIDIDPKAIQWMEEQKARFPIELQDRLVIRQAEPNDPKLKAQEVDLVLLVNTYSYISSRVPYFTKLKEAIRPGGDVIIIDFKKKETPFGPAIEERVDVADVEKELIEAGYTLLKIDQESLEYQYIIKARRI